MMPQDERSLVTSESPSEGEASIPHPYVNIVGNFSKEGRGYTKTSLNSSTHLEVSRPGKAFQLYVHEREGVLGSVNSKVGT